MTDFKSGVQRIKALEDSKKAIQAQAQKNYTQANQTKAIVDTITTVGMVLLDFARNNTSKVEITNPTAPTDLTELSTKLDALIEEELKASADTAMLDILGDIKTLLETVTQPQEKPEGPEEVIVENMIDYSECLARIEGLLGREQPAPVFDPTINVAPANVEIDFSEIKDEINSLSQAFGSFSIDIPAVDFSQLVEATNAVKDAVGAIVIPKPPNFVAAFKNAAGESVSAVIGDDGIISVTSKPTDKYSISATSETATYKYFFFEDASLNWYIMRKTLATNVFAYAKGTGGYESVYDSPTTDPDPAPTYGTYGEIF